MNRRVALLRGINVGTAKRVAMADLRKLFEDLGYRDVRTLLNSGNVVYTVTGKGSSGDGPRLEREIATRLAVTTQVTVLSARDIVEAVSENPFHAVAENPSWLLLLAVPDSGALGQLKPLLKARWTPEALALGRRVAYLWCANGIADSRLWVAVTRALGSTGTARNLATMTRLRALVENT